MTHKVYQFVDGFKMRTGMAPDGACMDIMATDVNGEDDKPITSIDYINLKYRRQGDIDWKDYPSKWYYTHQIVWNT